LPGYAINLLLDINVGSLHLVDLLEQNRAKSPFRKVSTHQRGVAKEVFDYKQRIDAGRLVLDDTPQRV